MSFLLLNSFDQSKIAFLNVSSQACCHLLVLFSQTKPVRALPMSHPPHTFLFQHYFSQHLHMDQTLLKSSVVCISADMFQEIL